jgi:membrane fusion protein (multidrug efflux system)
VPDPHDEPRVTAAPAEEAREPWPEETEEASKRSQARGYFRQHPRAKWALLIVLAILVFAGVQAWRYYSARESTDDAQVEAHIAPVSARVGGTVIQINVDNNQFVKAGTVLVRLDPSDYKVALERARAELADAEAGQRAARTTVPITSTSTSSTEAQARANLNAAQKEVNMAKARLVEAQANHKKTAQDLERMRQLVAKDEVSRQQYDSAEAAEAAAQATVEAARAAVAAAQSHVAQAEAALRGAQTAPQQVAVTEARAGAAGAAVQKQQTAVAQAELNLQYTTITAPVDGVVSKRTVELGQTVQPGQPLLSIVNLEDIWVTANFKETQLEYMKPGQKATIHVDAYDRDYRGYVDSIGGGTGAVFSLLPPENATGNYVKVVQRVPIRIRFDKGQDMHGLRPGMSVVTTVMVK